MNFWPPEAALTIAPQYAYVDQARASGSTARDGHHDAIEAKLDALAKLQQNWNTYGAEPPSEDSVRWAKVALLLLRDKKLCPSSAKASARGGAVLCFDEHPRYASLEFFNSGDIVLLTAARPGPPTTRQIRPHLAPLVGALAEISEFLSA